MKNFNSGLLITLFAGYVGKIAVTGATFPDALVVLFLGATYYMYNSQIQSKEQAELKQQLTTLSAQFAEVKEQQAETKSLVANAVAGFKMSHGFTKVK